MGELLYTVQGVFWCVEDVFTDGDATPRGIAHRRLAGRAIFVRKQ